MQVISFSSWLLNVKGRAKNTEIYSTIYYSLIIGKTIYILKFCFFFYAHGTFYRKQRPAKLL